MLSRVRGPMRSRETLLRLHRFSTEEKRRQVADIDSMIQDFMRKLDDLDAQAQFEETRHAVAGPSHLNYPRQGMLRLPGSVRRARHSFQATSKEQVLPTYQGSPAMLKDVQQSLLQAGF